MKGIQSLKKHIPFLGASAAQEVALSLILSVRPYVRTSVVCFTKNALQGYTVLRRIKGANRGQEDSRGDKRG